MTIHLPDDLACAIRAQVVSGHFASEDDVVAAAVRDYLRRQPQGSPPIAPVLPDPVLGSMRDDADLLDDIVDHAMKNRREQPWRLSPGE
jgi:hypothetical protein